MFEERAEQWFAVQGITPTPSASALFEFWRGELSDLPGDLLLAALRRVIHTHRWRHVPTVADLRAAVADDLRDRKDALRQLQTAQARTPIPRPTKNRERTPPRPETLRKLQEVTRSMRVRHPEPTAEDVERAKAEALRQLAEMREAKDDGEHDDES